jgi:hypothetical protein
MKKSTNFAFVVTLLLLPAFSHAGNVCFQNENGAIFRLSIKPTCKASSAKPAAVLGTFAPGGGIQCLGSNVIGVYGVCFGAPSEGASGKVHLNLTAGRIDHNNPDQCSLQSWNLIGDGLNLLTGSIERERTTSGTPFFADQTFTAVICP